MRMKRKTHPNKMISKRSLVCIFLVNLLYWSFLLCAYLELKLNIKNIKSDTLKSDDILELSALCLFGIEYKEYKV